MSPFLGVVFGSEHCMASGLGLLEWDIVRVSGRKEKLFWMHWDGLLY